MITVTPLPAFTDNYLWLVHANGRGVVVDPGDAAVIEAGLLEHGVSLSAILVTHHHPDHIGGVAQLREAHGVPVYGPRAEAGKISALTHLLDDGDRVSLPELSLELDVLAVPGHTLGHIAYHDARAGLLFCGDTLFAGGCGRLFEGTPQQMYRSLQRLAALPPQTQVFCAHEYTLSNLAFAQAVEPDRSALAGEVARVRALRAEGVASVPSTIARELDFNPFLRCSVPAVGEQAARQGTVSGVDAVSVFASLRSWKDRFRPPAAT